jgi:hypothetical protein
VLPQVIGASGQPSTRGVQNFWPREFTSRQCPRPDGPSRSSPGRKAAVRPGIPAHSIPAKVRRTDTTPHRPVRTASIVNHLHNTPYDNVIIPAKHFTTAASLAAAPPAGYFAKAAGNNFVGTPRQAECSTLAKTLAKQRRSSAPLQAGFRILTTLWISLVMPPVRMTCPSSHTCVARRERYPLF